MSTPLPMGQKIAFGIGMLGNQMFPAALSVFMVVLINGLGMSPLLWGLLFFIPRLVDALTDPIVGFISDNTRSRWGRRKPYIVIGSLLTGLSYIAMWQIYPENGELFNFFYFLFTSIIFYLGLTLFAIPYVAMGYEASQDYHERTRLMAIAQWIGQWAWVIVPWFWLILYDPEFFASPDEGARTLSIWVGIICMALTMVPALFCKTQPVDESQLQPLTTANIKNNVGQLFQGFKEALSNAPFRRLCIATFLVFNAFNTVAGFSFFIIVYGMFAGDAGSAGNLPAWFGTISALFTTFMVIPIITYLSQRYGKKNTFLIAQAISIVGYLLFLVLFDPTNPWMLFLALPLFAFGIGSLFTLMMSMTADICDLNELRTGKREEGLFGAIYWWMVKFGFAIAGLLSGIILAYAGFDSSVAKQTPETIQNLLFAYVFVPVSGTLLAMWVMRNYDLTEEKVHEIRAQLDATKGSR